MEDRHRFPLPFLVVIGIAFAIGSRPLNAQSISKTHSQYDEIASTISVEELIPFLKTDDAQNARLAILKLSKVDRRAAIPILQALWAGESVPQLIDYLATYQDPIVRVTIAEEIFKFSPHVEYSDYIKHAADHPSWIVQSVAAEALATVDDEDSIKILFTLAHSKNPFVAKSAVSSLSRIAHEGKYDADASLAIEALYNDPDIVLELVKKKIQRAYTERSVRASRGGASIIGQDIYSQNDEDSLDQEVHRYLKKKQYKAAVNWLTPIAISGNPKAQHLLGEVLLIVKPPEKEQAREWLERATSQNYVPAKTTLANLYLSGIGFEGDHKRGVQLLLEAAQEGDDAAQELLEAARRNGWWGM